MKLVTDGERFAIRKGGWFTRYQYRDIHSDYWWCDPDLVIKYCWGEEQEIRTIFEEMKTQRKRKEWVVK